MLAVPGNHDIPYTFPARFTAPWREFERQWQTTEPELIGEHAHIVGINSVRPWRHQSGGVSDEQLERVTSRLRQAAPGALRVVALHHQLIGAPWRSRKKPVAHRGRVLARLVDSGAELIVGGHIHQATVSERHEFEVITGDARGVVVSIAPGLGQPRPQRRGEARGVHRLQRRRAVARRRHLHLARRRLGAHGDAPLRTRPRAPHRRGLTARAKGLRNRPCPEVQYRSFKPPFPQACETLAQDRGPLAVDRIF